MHIFRNAQWIVTHEGIEAPAEGGYWIGMDRIGHTTERQGSEYYDWPLHLAEKNWVAIPLFLDAFVYALDFRTKANGHSIDWKMLKCTFDRAIEEALLTQQYEADSAVASREQGRNKVTWLHEFCAMPEVKRNAECREAIGRIHGLVCEFTSS